MLTTVPQLSPAQAIHQAEQRLHAALSQADAARTGRQTRAAKKAVSDALDLLYKTVMKYEA